MTSGKRRAYTATLLIYHPNPAPYSHYIFEVPTNVKPSEFIQKFNRHTLHNQTENSTDIVPVIKLKIQQTSQGKKQQKTQ